MSDRDISDWDSCVDEVLEYDDPDLRPTQDGRAMAQRLASEVSDLNYIETVDSSECTVAAPYVGSDGAGPSRYGEVRVNAFPLLDRALRRSTDPNPPKPLAVRLFGRSKTLQTRPRLSKL